VIDLFDAPTSRANFLMVVAFPKSVRLIRAGNKRMQLCLQVELAEEYHNHFAHRSHRIEHNKSTSRKRKIVTLNVIKSFVCRHEIGPKRFDKHKSKPGPTYDSGENNICWNLPKRFSQ